MPGAALHVSHGSSHSIIQTLTGDRDCHYPQFADEDSEAQGHLVTGTQLGSVAAGPRA